MYLFQIVIHPLKPYIRNFLFTEFPSFKDITDKLSDSISSKDDLSDLFTMRQFIRNIPEDFWNKNAKSFWRNNDGFVLIERLSL